MTQTPISLLMVACTPPALADELSAAGFNTTPADDLALARQHEVVLLQAITRNELAELALRPDLPQACFDSAVVVATGLADDRLEAELLRAGVEGIVQRGNTPALVRALRHAVVRKQVERGARNAYATDLATGLPHQAQLLEHMAQLLALREREPAPMVLLVLRVEGFARAAEKLGVEAGNILRRKVAVKLRGALRSGDVVAAISADSFGILLGHLEALTDGERVATKLVKALQAPIPVAGQPCSVSASVGLALYPQHGKQAQQLLQRASAQAGSVATLGSQGFAGAAERLRGGGAANDDGV